MQSPTAVPRMPASASGVSTQRSGPKRSRKPAVARKTPPARPTSSPSTMTVASRSSSTCSASFTASTSSFSATEHSPQLREVVLERLRRVDERVLEHEPDVRRRLCLGGRDPGPHQLRRLRLDPALELVAEDADPAQVPLVAPEALVPPLVLDPPQVDVRLRVVGRRMRRAPVRDRLDERRPLPRAGARDRLPRRLVDGEHVAAVDAGAGDPVARGLVDERLGPG